MEQEKIKELLGQQLQLLAQQAETAITGHELAEITNAMINVARFLSD